MVSFHRHGSHPPGFQQKEHSHCNGVIPSSRTKEQTAPAAPCGALLLRQSEFGIILGQRVNFFIAQRLAHVAHAPIDIVMS